METADKRSRTLLGKRLRRARICAEISAEQLAKRLSYSVSQVLRWEWGDSEPPFETLQAVALVYGLTVGQLVDGVLPERVDMSDEEPPPSAAGGRP
jgi:transcriptional regulator with XRE-family HTH domain